MKARTTRIRNRFCRRGFHAPLYLSLNKIMNQINPNQTKKQTQIKASDEKLKGEYSNMMQIIHNKEEFVLDFLNVFPPTGTLNSRVIVSPGHYKRMIKAMQDSLQKYEENYGKIEEASEPEKQIGFKGE